MRHLKSQQLMARLLGWLLAFSLLAQIGCGGKLLDIPLEVKALSWERVIYLEEYKTVPQEAWADELPKDAKKISSRIVPQGTSIVTGEETYTEKERYACGTTSYGPRPYQRSPKYCERDVARTRAITRMLTEDRERVTYETQVWQEAEKTKASIAKGDGAQEPSWNEPKVDNKTTRAGRRTEFYSVTFATVSGAAKTYDRSMSFEDWLKYEPGQKVIGKFWNKSSNPVTFEAMK